MDLDSDEVYVLSWPEAFDIAITQSRYMYKRVTTWYFHRAPRLVKR